MLDIIDSFGSRLNSYAHGFHACKYFRCVILLSIAPLPIPPTSPPPPPCLLPPRLLQPSAAFDQSSRYGFSALNVVCPGCRALCSRVSVSWCRDAGLRVQAHPAPPGSRTTALPLPSPNYLFLFAPPLEIAPKA